MDTLVKDKLKMKPRLSSHKPVEVKIRIDAPVAIKGITIRDVRDTSQSFDMNKLKERLQESKLSHVTMKIPSAAPIETPLSLVPQGPPVAQPKKRAKKISKKQLLIIDEDETRKDVQDEVIIPEPDDEESALIIRKPVEKESVRRTPRVQRGVAELGPEEWVDIGVYQLCAIMAA